MAKNSIEMKYPQKVEKSKPNKKPLGDTGYPTTGTKTTGIKMRGTGAAVRGITSRGPMA